MRVDQDLEAIMTSSAFVGRVGGLLSVAAIPVTAYVRTLIGQLPAIACRTAATTASGRWFWM